MLFFTAGRPDTELWRRLNACLVRQSAIVDCGWYPHNQGGEILEIWDSLCHPSNFSSIRNTLDGLSEGNSTNLWIRTLSGIYCYQRLDWFRKIIYYAWFRRLMQFGYGADNEVVHEVRRGLTSR